MFRTQVKRAGIALATIIVVAMLAAIALAFVFVAAHLWLATQMEPALAAVVTGAAALAIAGLTSFILLKSIGRRRRRKGRSHRTTPDSVGGMLRSGGGGSGGLDELSEAARLFAKQNPGTAVLTAFSAGITLGMSPTTRRTVADMLRQWSDAR